VRYGVMGSWLETINWKATKAKISVIKKPTRSGWASLGSIENVQSVAKANKQHKDAILPSVPSGLLTI
jgi:hypothetical protein